MPRDTSLYQVDGCRVPSVTETISLAGLVSFGGAPYDAIEKAGIRGKAIHDWCEAYNRNAQPSPNWNSPKDLPKLPKKYHPYCQAYVKFVKEMGLEITRIECVVIDDFYKYAGQMDLTGFLRNSQYPDDEWVIDIKSSAKLPPTTALQTAAYALPLPGQLNSEGEPPYRRAGLHLKPDGRYKLQVYEDVTDYAVWLAAVRLAHWKLDHGIDKLED